METENHALNRALFWVGIVFCLSVLAAPVINTDLFWRLSAGRHFWANFSVPRADWLSWTMGGHSWSDLEWLAQAVYYPLYRLGGLLPLFMLRFVLLCFALYPAFKILELCGLEKTAFAALPVFALGLYPNSDLRPENFSVLFFTVEFYLLEKLRTGWAPVYSWKLFAAVSAAFSLWANLHCGFALGLVLAGFYCADFVVSGFFKRQPQISAKGGALFLIILAAASGAIANPYGYKVYGALIEYYRALPELSGVLIEWRPPSPLDPLQLPYLLLLFSAFGMLIYDYLKNKRLVYAHAFALAYFGLSSSAHARFTVFLSIAAFVSLSSGVGAMVRTVPFEKIKQSALFTAGFCLFYGFFCVWPRNLSKAPPPGREADGLVSYLSANRYFLSAKKLYNPWALGGVLGWRLAPDYKVFWDGRYIFSLYIKDMRLALESPEAWAFFAAKYNFELAILGRDDRRALVRTVMGGKPVLLQRPEYLLFMPKTDWALVYWDARLLVFVRKDKTSAEWLKSEELKFVRAGDFSALQNALCMGEARPEEIKEELKIFAAKPGLSKPPEEFIEFRDWLGEYPGNCGVPVNSRRTRRHS
ncbi:MAG TPA: hypothetical protein DCL44_08240 [Elusimicrobia bacterium]|nr:hypothetical protein [Elusimicrobiota bacterium]